MDVMVLGKNYATKIMIYSVHWFLNVNIQ